jgi:hypothetical protein
LNLLGQHLDNLHDLCESTLVGRKLDVDLRLSALTLEDGADLVKQWRLDVDVAIKLTQELEKNLLTRPRPRGHQITVLEAVRRRLDDTPTESAPIDALFERVVDRCRGLYGETRWADPTLELDEEYRHSASWDDSYGVSAQTPGARSETPHRRVQVSFDPLHFGPATYAALAYLLIHECVCHAGSGHQGADLESPFAEGFLDYAARHLLPVWVDQVAPEFPAAALRHGLRFADVVLHRRGMSPARSVGLNAASTVENWFQRRRGWDRERCRRQVTHLAVELNQSSLELSVKETFVSLLFGEPSPELGDALDEYLSTADVVTRADVLLRKVQQLGGAA